MAVMAAATTTIQATGRRKTSVARIQLRSGNGKVLINDREVSHYITIPTLRDLALSPLLLGEAGKKFDVAVTVSGGGPSGQAGAIRHGLARALLKAQPELKPDLRKRGMLTRDPRMKERKKYGQPGARKRFQFSKR